VAGIQPWIPIDTLLSQPELPAETVAYYAQEDKHKIQGTPPGFRETVPSKGVKDEGGSIVVGRIRVKKRS
jgi:hypothetical protein